MKLPFFCHAVIILFAWAGVADTEPLKSHFECKSQGAKEFRPFYLQAIENQTKFKDYSQTPKGLLGQNAMTSSDECQRAVMSANQEYGVICSRTGLNGWKPTIFTGTIPGRPDFGYLGGSSIMKFEDCLAVTVNSSWRGVCFWGGSEWYISPIDKEGFAGGPFSSVEACTRETKE